MSLTEVPVGFLVLKTFPRVYRDYVQRYNLRTDFYGLPRIDTAPEEARIQYRGVDRDGLSGFAGSELPAEVYLAELERLERCSVEGVIFSLEDATQVYDRLGPQKPEYEIVWAQVVKTGETPPAGFRPIGYEPSTFFGDDHFSASCDCMLFPRWHGTDKDGTLFRPYFEKLNRHGVFNAPGEAEEFLKYYLSFDWTERGDFQIVEVCIRDEQRE